MFLSRGCSLRKLFFAVEPYREEPGGEGGIETVADGISDGQWTAYRTGGGRGGEGGYHAIICHGEREETLLQYFVQVVHAL